MQVPSLGGHRRSIATSKTPQIEQDPNEFEVSMAVGDHPRPLRARDEVPEGLANASGRTSLDSHIVARTMNVTLPLGVAVVFLAYILASSN